MRYKITNSQKIMISAFLNNLTDAAYPLKESINTNDCEEYKKKISYEIERLKRMVSSTELREFISAYRSIHQFDEGKTYPLDLVLKKHRPGAKKSLYTGVVTSEIYSLWRYAVEEISIREKNISLYKQYLLVLDKAYKRACTAIINAHRI